MKNLNMEILENLEGGSLCPNGYRASGAASIPAGVCIDAIGWGWCNATSATQILLLCQATDGSIMPVVIH